MSILVEIASRADVSVEGVVRVLTREPVSVAIKERVLAVLDELDADQTRVLERFALASVHDVVPLGDGPVQRDGAVESPPEPADRAQQPVVEQKHAGGNGSRPPDLSPPGEGASGSERPTERGVWQQPGGAEPTALSDEAKLTARVGMLLEELVAATTEMMRESRVDRQERLDDLALLVELMSTGWQGVDRRLGRIERVLERMEAAPQRLPERLPAPARSEPAPVPLAPVPEPAPPIEPSRKEKQAWPPFVTTLLFLASLIVVLLALDLLPSRSDLPSLAPTSEETPTGPRASSTTAAGAPTQAPGTPTATETETDAKAEVKGVATTTTASQPPTVPPQPSAPTATETEPARLVAPPAGTSIRPVDAEPREFLWPSVEGAKSYLVRFLRDGRTVHASRVSVPRLTIPAAVFVPGEYRWVVRPAIGAGSGRLGDPVVDSAFSVKKP